MTVCRQTVAEFAMNMEQNLNPSRLLVASPTVGGVHTVLLCAVFFAPSPNSRAPDSARRSDKIIIL
jgi:hypothetical protein